MGLIAKGKSTTDKRPDFAEVVPMPWGDDTPSIPWPTIEEAVTSFRRELDEVIRFRIAAMDSEPELRFLEQQLDDPSLDDHPKRNWAVRRHRALYEAQEKALVRMLIAIYHMNRTWVDLTVRDRVQHALHTLIGLDARTDDLRDLVDINHGPLQAAAPFMDDWTLPDEFGRRIPANLAITLNIAPF